VKLAVVQLTLRTAELDKRRSKNSKALAAKDGSWGWTCPICEGVISTTTKAKGAEKPKSEKAMAKAQAAHYASKQCLKARALRGMAPPMSSAAPTSSCGPSSNSSVLVDNMTLQTETATQTAAVPVELVAGAHFVRHCLDENGEAIQMSGVITRVTESEVQARYTDKIDPGKKLACVAADLAEFLVDISDGDITMTVG
jgi:hypothetical protein